MKSRPPDINKQEEVVRVIRLLNNNSMQNEEPYDSRQAHLSYEIQVGEKDGIVCEEFSLHGTL